jgi:hypothetical protein
MLKIFYDHCGLTGPGFISIIILLVICVGFASNWYTAYRCDQYENLAGIETTYSQFDTCYVRVGDEMQRWDEYISRSAASDGLSKLAD